MFIKLSVRCDFDNELLIHIIKEMKFVNLIKKRKFNHNALNWMICDINENAYIEASQFSFVAKRNLTAEKLTDIYMSSNCCNDNMITVVEIREKLLLTL